MHLIIYIKHKKHMASWLLFSLILLTTWKICNAFQSHFLECMIKHDSNLIHTQDSSLYINLLQSAEQNPRWFNSKSTRPQFIITPSKDNEIQAAILCSRNNGLQIRVKSGGHDYEGLSFISEIPFVMIDLVNFKSISINLDDETAWVKSGATLGELYYEIAKKTNKHGFPAGICPSVGVGGHFSGGGIGTMTRKYGLAADNVVDANMIDVEGRILDRKTMGEDLFWAIRGGGAASFGVVLAWKIKLVQVPEVVSAFRVQREMDTLGIELVHKWQEVAPKLLPPELFIRVVVQNGNGQTNKTVVALFESMFLGRKDELIDVMSKRFPELGLKVEDISEMSWIESEIYFAFQKEQPWEVLLNRTVLYKSSFKGKSDFVEKPIPIKAFKGICDRILKEEIAYMILEPLGGKMDEISDSSTPFPHRKGCLYNIQYVVKWGEDSVAEEKKHLEWMNEFFDFMKSYVSNSPRRAYINYRDLDIGINQKEGNTSYSQAKIWGDKYFRENFKKLAQVKSKADPGNFFRNEQSVPVLDVPGRPTRPQHRPFKSANLKVSGKKNVY